MGESVGVLWNACRVGIDVCIMSPMITHEGLVYMSHGRSLSLPGPHDTGDGAGVGPY